MEADWWEIWLEWIAFLLCGADLVVGPRQRFIYLLFIYLFIYLFIQLFVYLFIYLCIQLFIYLLIQLFIYLPIQPNYFIIILLLCVNSHLIICLSICPIFNLLKYRPLNCFDKIMIIYTGQSLRDWPNTLSTMSRPQVKPRPLCSLCHVNSSWLCGWIM